MNTLEAPEIRAALRGKLAEADARVADLAGRRPALAFDCHLGRTGAAKELNRLDLELVKARRESEMVALALSEVGRRIEAAKAADAAEAERTRLRTLRDEVLEIVRANEGRGARIAQAAATLRDELKRLDASMQQLRVLGAPVVGGRVLALALERSITPVLREGGMDFPFTPHSQRHDAQLLVSGYLSAATVWASKLLPDAPKDEEAA